MHWIVFTFLDNQWLTTELNYWMLDHSLNILSIELNLFILNWNQNYNCLKYFSKTVKGSDFKNVTVNETEFQKNTVVLESKIKFSFGICFRFNIFSIDLLWSLFEFFTSLCLAVSVPTRGENRQKERLLHLTQPAKWSHWRGNHRCNTLQEKIGEFLLISNTK